jgi:hypothetical protein
VGDCVHESQRGGGQRATRENVKKAQELWEKRFWHASHQEFSCENDAQQAWTHALKGKPSFPVHEQGQSQQKGSCARPCDLATRSHAGC